MGIYKTLSSHASRAIVPTDRTLHAAAFAKPHTADTEPFIAVRASAATDCTERKQITEVSSGNKRARSPSTRLSHSTFRRLASAEGERKQSRLKHNTV